MLAIKSDAQFRAALAGAERVVVADFTAVWCGPCKELKPMLESYAARRPDVQFLSLDLDTTPKTFKAHKVDSFPTVIVFVDGAAAATVEGNDMGAIERAVEAAAGAAPGGAGSHKRGKGKRKGKGKGKASARARDSEADASGGAGGATDTHDDSGGASGGAQMSVKVKVPAAEALGTGKSRVVIVSVPTSATLADVKAALAVELSTASEGVIAGAGLRFAGEVHTDDTATLERLGVRKGNTLHIVV